MNFFIGLIAIAIALFFFAVFWLLSSLFVQEFREKEGQLTKPSKNPDQPRRIQPVDWVIGLILLVTVFMILNRCDGG